MIDDSDSIDYSDFEHVLGADPELEQPPKDVAHKWIGWLTLAGVLVILGTIIVGGYVGLSTFLLLAIPIGEFLLFFGWIIWLIERGNRHPN